MPQEVIYSMERQIADIRAKKYAYTKKWQTSNIRTVALNEFAICLKILTYTMVIASEYILFINTLAYLELRSILSALEERSTNLSASLGFE